jgi:hypothetical protein
MSNGLVKYVKTLLIILGTGVQDAQKRDSNNNHDHFNKKTYGSPHHREFLQV